MDALEKLDNTFIKKYEKLVVATSSRLYKHNRPVYELGDLNDVIQIGMIGLIKAHEKFKPELGFTFNTYAVHRIRGEILDRAREAAFIKVPKLALIKGAKHIIVTSFCNMKDHILAGLKIDFDPANFDPEDYRTRQKSNQIVSKIIDKREDIKIFLRTLSNKHLYLIVRYYGLDGEKPDTLKVIAKQLNRSEAWACLILKKIKIKAAEYSCFTDYKKAS